ncbi:MAG: hypothetical protein IE880_04680 [Epsilonproteobacteria bacterium]|nr:hypothetical protein [Campylobacterota bacterium]
MNGNMTILDSNTTIYLSKRVLSVDDIFIDKDDSYEPNIETHKDLEMIEYKDTLQQADIATFLVAHKEFKKLDVKTNLDFCGGN